MNTPKLAQDFYDSAHESQPFITCKSKGDPDPNKQEFSVVCKFRTLAGAQDFHAKLCRFLAPRISDEAPAAKTANELALEQRCKGLLDCAQMAYRKHVLNDDNIGWEQLETRLLNGLCNAMGDEGFQKWLEEQTE